METIEEAAERHVNINVAKNIAKLMYKEHFIEGAKWQQEQDKKCYHPMTERKHTSDVHFECTICGYNNY